MTTCYPITNYAMKDGNHTVKLNDDADDNDIDNDGIIKVKKKTKRKVTKKTKKRSTKVSKIPPK